MVTDTGVTWQASLPPPPPASPIIWGSSHLLMNLLPGDTGVDGGSGAGEGAGRGESSARVLRALEEMMSRHFPIENSREPVEGSKEAAAFASLLRGLLGAFIRYDCCEGSKVSAFMGGRQLSARACGETSSCIIYTWYQYAPKKVIIVVIYSTPPLCFRGGEMLLRLFITLSIVFFFVIVHFLTYSSCSSFGWCEVFAENL